MDSLGELMRKSWVRILVGICSFALPALMANIGMRLDESRFRHDPTYRALVPPVMLGSVVLAAVVPAALIMTTALSLPRRIGLAAAVWSLLAIECAVTVYVVLMEALR